jgi:hypothetical protein
MNLRFTRKTLMFAGITAATVIGASSVAFACLVTKGQIQLTGTQATGAVVQGTGVQHGFCANPTPAAKTYHGTTGQVTVAVAPTTCGTTSTQLDDGATYQVVLQKSTTSYNWVVSGSAWTWNTLGAYGCFGGTAAATVTLATTFNVVSGAATGTFNIPAGVAASSAGNAHGICVGTPTSSGAFAPLELS